MMPRLTKKAAMKIWKEYYAYMEFEDFCWMILGREF